MRNKITILVKIVLAIGLVFLVLQGVDFSSAKEAFLAISPLTYLWALLVQCGIQLCQALRWRLLANANAIPFREYFAFSCLGNAMLLVSPGAVVSDTINGILLGRRHHFLETSVTAILLGRVIGVLSLAGLFMLFLPFNLVHLKALQGLEVIGLRTAAILVLLLVLAGLGLLYWKKPVTVRKYQTALREIVSKPKHLAYALPLSFAIQGGTILIAYLGYRAIGAPISWIHLFFFGPLILILSLIPISIGQVGVREALNIYFLTTIPGVHKEMILGNAAYGYALMLMLAFINMGVAFALLRKGNQPT